MENIAIIGANTNARVIYKFIKHYGLFNVVCFAVDEEYLNSDNYCNLPLVSIDRLQDYIRKDRDKIFIGVQWNRLNKDRLTLYNRLKQVGYKFANIVSPTAVLHEDVIMGDNIWIADNVIIEADVKIGSNTFLKSACVVSESTEIMEHCFIGMRAAIGGACIIGEQSFIGINATVYDEVLIGRKCIVGAAASVNRNLPEFNLVKKNFESQIYKEYDSDTIEEKLIAKKNIR